MTKRILTDAQASDISQLMTWFSDSAAIAAWGGPAFRFPFTESSFHKDCRWPDMASFVLRDDDGLTEAFGQLYERYGRINLARIAVHPDRRGRRLGQQLLTGLITEGQEMFSLAEFSLFVLINNSTALRLYNSMGFQQASFPEGAPLQDVCLYMTRPVSRV